MMFKRLFGETEAVQLEYLQSRTIITFIFLIVGAICTIFLSSSYNILIAIPFMFIWGKNALTSLFHITSVAIFFSSNFMIGVLIFFLYIVAVYLAGIVCAFIGIGRWIYLKVKQSKGMIQ